MIVILWLMIFLFLDLNIVITSEFFMTRDWFEESMDDIVSFLIDDVTVISN